MSFDKLINNSIKSIKLFNKYIDISGGNQNDSSTENRIASEAKQINEELAKKEADEAAKKEEKIKNDINNNLSNENRIATEAKQINEDIAKKEAADAAIKKAEEIKNETDKKNKQDEINRTQNDIYNKQIKNEKNEKDKKDEENRKRKHDEEEKQKNLKNLQDESEKIRNEKIKADKEAAENARIKKEDEDFANEESNRMKNEQSKKETKDKEMDKLKKDQEIANEKQKKFIEDRLKTTSNINIDVLKNISNELYDDLTILLKDNSLQIEDQNIIKILSTFDGLKYRKHPYPELIDNNLIGGAININNLKSLINLPNKWLQEHQKMYRDTNLLKLVSLKVNSIKDIPLFYNDKRLIKLLVLILFWDAQELIKKSEELSKDLNELNGLDDINVKNNNKIISKLTNFSDTDIGKTAKFVLTEDLIKFYKTFSDKYSAGVENFDFNDSYIFSLLIQDYTHWKQTESNFNKLKKKLIEISNDIDYEYNELNEEPSKTYLKIRNDNQKDKTYNELYNIFINTSIDNSQSLQSLYITDSKSKLEKLYGPFTRIFLPNETNINCQEILNSLMKEKKSVFVFGSGQKNAGKTSTLIYNNHTKQNGIILELLKNKDLAILEIEVTVKELYSHKKINNWPQLSTNSYNKIKFRRNNVYDEFKLDENLSNNQSGIYYQDKKDNENNKEREWKIIDGIFFHSNNSNEEFLGINGQPNKNIEKIRSLNDFIIYLTNNKITNKSHQLFFFKMNYLSSNVYLVLGDLVGAEELNNEEISSEFINNTLYGMNKDLAEITKKSSREYALFQKIPIFNSQCLNYYCNSALYNCFKLDKNKSYNLDDSIFKTIYKVIGKKDELVIAMFGIINISKNVNNPPKTEYIDLIELQLLREKLYTNQMFENNESIIKDSVNKIVSNLESINIKEIIDKKNELTKADTNKVFDLLVEIIQIIEKNNLTTLIGTLDSLNYIKNSLQTDISCNIKGLEKTNLYNYQNIVTSKTLQDTFEHQKGGSNYKQSLIKEYKQLLKMYTNIKKFKS